MPRLPNSVTSWSTLLPMALSLHNWLMMWGAPLEVLKVFPVVLSLTVPVIDNNDNDNNDKDDDNDDNNNNNDNNDDDDTFSSFDHGIKRYIIKSLDVFK